MRRAELDEVLTDESRTWLDDSVAAIERDPTAIRTLFPAAGREVGRHDLGGYSSADAARVVMLSALGDRVLDEIGDLYRFGDSDERRSILVALDLLSIPGDSGIGFVRDALRSNDTRLVRAALGIYGLEHLGDHELYNAVLKCIFMDIPLADIDNLAARVTPDLSRMVASFVHERVAAGRDVSADVWLVIDKFPPTNELEAIEAELQSPVDERRQAAERALKLRQID